MKIREKIGGFTVIELLAGMTLVVLMVLFLTKIFTDTSTAWASSTKRVESNMAGRTAVQFMARELAAAIVDDTLTLKLESDEDLALGLYSDRIYFMTSDQRAQLGSSPNYYRQTKGIAYKISPMKHPVTNTNLPHRFRVMRAGLEDYASTNFMPYTDSQWWQRVSNDTSLFQETLVENVRALEFWVFDRNGNQFFSYDSSVHGPPAFMDVMIELLPDSDARRIALIGNDADRDAYSDRVARRYFTRVHFHNFQGYALAP